MKPSFAVLSVALLVATSPLASFGETAAPTGQQLYEKGRAAFYRGDLPEARRCFEKLLKTKPDFELARIHLAQIAVAERELAKIPASLKLARAAVIDRIEWSERSLEEAMTAVARELERARAGAEEGSVAISGHLPAAVRERTVRMSASQVSPDNVLEALGFAAAVQISYVGEGLAVRELGEVRGMWDAGDPKQPSMEAAARKIILDRLLMADASTADALEYLQRKAVDLSGGKVRPIFVIRHDSAPRDGVSLELRNVSLYDAVRSVCLVSDLEEKWFPWGAGIANRQAAAAVTGSAENKGAK
jgi:tetratricopeptide (TPR) repeat protein